MRTMKRRALLVIAGAALAAAAVPSPMLAAELNVCTWLTQRVGDAVTTISAAPGAVLGPNNGGFPGGDKGPFDISFTSSEALALTATALGGGCS